MLRTLARVLAPTTGAVLLDGRELHRRPSREVARRLALLPRTRRRPTASPSASGEPCPDCPLRRDP